MKRFFLFLLFFLLSSCASKPIATLSSDDLKLFQIRKAIKASLPVSIRKLKSNNRVLYSEYFLRRGSQIEKPTAQSLQRTHVVVYIIGEKAPYKIRIEVRQEKRKSSLERFKFSGYDSALTRVLSRRLKQNFSRVKTNFNFLDDFRVF